MQTFMVILVKCHQLQGALSPDQGHRPWTGPHWGTAPGPHYGPSTLIPDFFVALAFK